MEKKSQIGMSVHEKALLLIEGGIVACNGLPVKLIDVVGKDIACTYCEMDSACNKDMVDLCCACDVLTGTRHYLKLVSR